MTALRPIPARWQHLRRFDRYRTTRAIRRFREVHLHQRRHAEVSAALASDGPHVEATTTRAVVGQERKVTA